MLARSMQLRYQVRNSLGVKCVTPGLIHPSAWNRNSANFAFWAFSEVRAEDVRLASCRRAGQALSEEDTFYEHLSHQDPSSYRRIQGGRVGRPNRSGHSPKGRL